MGRAGQWKKRRRGGSSRCHWFGADGRKITMRSKWELTYATYLEHLKLKGKIATWEYECQEFEFPVKRGNKFYKPDFKVTLPDGRHFWVEVKGWLDASSKTKLKRFAKYYPEEHLRLVQEDEMKKIRSMHLRGWTET